jgi:hypothetical protein
MQAQPAVRHATVIEVPAQHRGEAKHSCGNDSRPLPKGEFISWLTTSRIVLYVEDAVGTLCLKALKEGTRWKSGTAPQR